MCTVYIFRKKFSGVSVTPQIPTTGEGQASSPYLSPLCTSTISLVQSFCTTANESTVNFTWQQPCCRSMYNCQQRAKFIKWKITIQKFCQLRM